MTLTALQTAAAALLVALATAMPAPAADDATPGAQEYRNHCQACHGEDGTGGGDLAQLMTVPIPDLTTIAERNEGRFPVQTIFMIVDGRTGIRGHGYPMPVWGTRFRAEAGDTYGPFGAEQVVRARVLELVYYLHALQK